MIEVRPGLAIPEGELTFETSRSSGPGGQNVNKVETRVTLRFDLAGSPSLDDAQRQTLAEKLAGRIDKRGVLRVTSQRHRSQAANRQATVERFTALLAEALTPEAERRPTRPGRAARRRRLDAKRRRSRIKEGRRKPPPAD